MFRLQILNLKTLLHLQRGCIDMAAPGRHLCTTTQLYQLKKGT